MGKIYVVTEITAIKSLLRKAQRVSMFLWPLELLQQVENSLIQ